MTTQDTADGGDGAGAQCVLFAVLLSGRSFLQVLPLQRRWLLSPAEIGVAAGRGPYSGHLSVFAGCWLGGPTSEALLRGANPSDRSSPVLGEAGLFPRSKKELCWVWNLVRLAGSALPWPGSVPPHSGPVHCPALRSL